MADLRNADLRKGGPHRDIDATTPIPPPESHLSPTPLHRGVRKTAEVAPDWARRFRASLSTPGLLVGTLFFAASLSPSLLPRGYLMQGILSGLSLTAGYGIGSAHRWLWGYLELPLPDRRTERLALWAATTICVATAVVFLWEASEWQNSIRVLMEMEPVESARPFRVGAIAASIFTVLLALGRLFLLTFRLLADRLDRRIPTRVANVIGLLIAGMLFWSVVDGVLFRFTLRAADSSFQQMDARIEADVAPPTDPMRTGSRVSLVSWDDLGRTGRAFVSSGPTGAEIGGFLARSAGGALGPVQAADPVRAPDPTQAVDPFQAPDTTQAFDPRQAADPIEALDPIRVYVGLNAAPTIEERAQLALDELQRVGAFDRSVLVLVTPTGTGWVDPSAMGPVEYLQRGDIASVAVQYSYLPSWLSLLAEPEYGAETARAVFRAVYGHWTGLERESRPALYLYGISLGALNSDQSADLYDVIADPFAGALWAGPPFRSESWRAFTEQRQPGSPAWLPRFRDGSVVRFMNQYGTSAEPSWGPLRIVYLQYGSDPITFFEPQSFYRKPAWLDEPRAPDVSDRLRWFPVVTMLQLLADLAVGDASPPGYGHVYAAEHYIDAWLALMDPPGWTAEGVRRLKALYAAPEKGSGPAADTARSGGAPS